MGRFRQPACALRGQSLRAATFAAAWLQLLPSASTAQPRRESGHLSAPTKAQTVELDVVVGENKTVAAGDVASYSVGAGGVVDVKLTPDSSQFIFSGVRPGTATVLLIKHNGAELTYNVNVFARSPAVVQGELEQLLVGNTGLKIRKIGSRFFIEGGVSTEADAKRIQIIAGLYPGQVESLVVTGSVGAEHTINIRIDFFFVQYDRSSNYGVGISWPSQIGGGAHLGLTRDLVANTTGARAALDQPLPSLDLAATHGWAKVLKQSTVITTSGAEATFENGGEQNFAVATGLTGTIQAIPFGTNVTVLPRFDTATGDMDVKVVANVSDLTAPASTSTLPGRKTSRVMTFLHLKLGQSIVLSGIRSQSETHAVSGLPLLSQIPLLGLLFGGHSDSKADIEGAVFIIPSVVEAVPRKSFDMVESAMSQYESYSGDLRKIHAYPKAPPSYGSGR